MFETFTFTNAELFQLSSEVQSLLGEKINLLVRYKLTDLSQRINKALDPYIEIRNRSIKEISPDGVIPNFIEKDGTKIQNPLMIKFQKVMEPIEAESKEIKFKKIPLSMIKHIETAGNAFQIFKLIEMDIEDEKEAVDDKKTKGKR